MKGILLKDMQNDFTKDKFKKGEIVNAKKVDDGLIIRAKCLRKTKKNKGFERIGIIIQEEIKQTLNILE